MGMILRRNDFSLAIFHRNAILDAQLGCIIASCLRQRLCANPMIPL